jgi:hypothetical protein
VLLLAAFAGLIGLGRILVGAAPGRAGFDAPGRLAMPCEMKLTAS